MANDNDEIIGRYVHGDASEADLAQLGQILERDPAAIKQFVAAAELECDLHEFYRPVASRSRAKKALPAIRTARNSRKTAGRPFTWIAAAAGVAALLAVAASFIFLNKSEQPVVARMLDTVPSALLIRDGEQIALKAEMDVRTGDRIRVPASRSVKIEFPDHTRLTLGSADSDQTLALFDDYVAQRGTAGSDGKKIRLESGAMSANVTPQPKGRPMILATSRATAEVVGTQLKLSVEKEATRLDVLEGKVRLRRLSDFAVAEVTTGEFAVAAKDVDFTPRALAPNAHLVMTCDDKFELYLNGVLLGQREWAKGTMFFEAMNYDLALQRGKNVIAVKGGNIDNVAGLLAELEVGSKKFVSGPAWKVSHVADPNWNTAGYDDSKWASATEYGVEKKGRPGRHARAARFPMESDAAWIWSDNNMFVPGKDSENTIYFRFTFDSPGSGK